MSIKTVYEALETMDNGSELVDIVKGELGKVVDLEAKLRLKDKELASTAEKFEATNTQMEELKAKAEENTQGKTEFEKQLNTLQKQINTMTERLETSEKEKANIENERKTASLKADFGNSLNSMFGEKFGDTLTKNMIAEGSLKYDDNGKVIFENEKGVYSKDEALEIIKGEYKDYLRPSGGGSGSPPPKPNTRARDGKSFADMDSAELFAMDTPE